MSRLRLLLIRCSTILRWRDAKLRGKFFRSLVIHKHGRAPRDLRENSWVLAFQVMELGLLFANGNYVAFLQATMTFITGADSAWQRIDTYEAS
jgi:hypothetical protein